MLLPTSTTLPNIKAADQCRRIAAVVVNVRQAQNQVKCKMPIFEIALPLMAVTAISLWLLRDEENR